MKHTIVMRVKETADDYRLFPEPDLAPYDLSDEFIEGVRAKLARAARPEGRPLRRGVRPVRVRCSPSGRPSRHGRLLRSVHGGAGKDAAKLAKPVANLAINDVTAWLNASEDADLAQSPLTPARAVELVKLLAEDAISSKQAKQVFSAIMDEDKDPSVIVEERGMKQVSDTGAIEAVVDAIIAANPDEVARYKEGNTKVIGFFVGQCMKEMRGQGNPKIINQLLAKKLAE